MMIASPKFLSLTNLSGKRPEALFSRPWNEILEIGLRCNFFHSPVTCTGTLSYAFCQFVICMTDSSKAMFDFFQSPLLDLPMVTPQAVWLTSRNPTQIRYRKKPISRVKNFDFEERNWGSSDVTGAISLSSAFFGRWIPWTHPTCKSLFKNRNWRIYC